MTDLEMFTSSVRILSEICPSTVIVVPVLNRGLPPGSWNLSDLLCIIVLNLEGKIPLCREGAPHVQP